MSTHEYDLLARGGALIRISVLLALVSAASCQRNGDSLASMGTLEVDRIEVRADSSEPIVEFAVVEGDRVQKGDLLLRQDPERFESLLEQANADVAVAEARLAEAVAGPRSEDIAAGRARVEAAASEVQTAKVELEREQSLADQNYATKNYVEVLEGRYRTAIAHRKEAQAMLDQLLAGTRPEQLTAARETLNRARAKLKEVALSLERSRVTAPVTGRVETLLYELGERPQAGQSLVVLLRDQAPYARVNVPEPIRSRLEPGAAAEVRIDGYSSPRKGRLRWIAHDASYTPFFALTQHDRSHLSYLAEVDLIGPDAEKIPTGVPVEVYFPGASDE